MSRTETFSIRQMVELTGLSEFTIRGWETRYSAFDPQRTDTGRREYSKKDVERALLLRELLKRGHKISKVAPLPHIKLQNLFELSESAPNHEGSEPIPKAVHEALELMALQKWSKLENLLANQSSKDPSQLVYDFFLPLIKTLSIKVQSDFVSIAQEHILSSFLKEKIYSLLNEFSKSKPSLPKSKHRIVLATPEGDYHEIGLLLAHLLIRAAGQTSLYVGPHTPARDLAETALRFEATHILVVSTVSKKQGARQDLLSYVSDLKNHLSSSMQILIAGSQSPLISTPGEIFTVLPNFEALETLLKTKTKGKSL